MREILDDLWLEPPEYNPLAKGEGEEESEVDIELVFDEVMEY
jgi:hypothetical protein